MRGHEIVSSIAWAGDVDPDVIASITAAIIDLDRRVHGTNRIALGALDVHQRMTAYVDGRGSYRAAAEALGISKSFLYDMHAGNRPITPAVLRRLGLQKSVREVFYPID